MRGQALVLAAAASLACRTQRPGAGVTAVPVAAPAIDPGLVRALTALATRRAPSAAELAALTQRLASGQLTLDGYLDQLVAGPELARAVMPLVVLRQFAATTPIDSPSRYVLQHTDGARPIYFLHEPCAAAHAVAVRPWWDLDHEVLVCEDSYRPTRWEVAVPKGAEPLACLSGHGSLEERTALACGCGPNLIRCFDDEARRQRLAESLMAEARDTIAYVVEHDLPLEAAFTANQSFRNRDAELIRRTQIVEARRDERPEAFLREVASWPAAGQWAARDDLATGQNAGILTTPTLLFELPDRRQRASLMYDVLWCMDPDSTGATPATVLATVGTNSNLQVDSAGWEALAARPLCTNCHARLDYGAQFFLGYPHAFKQAFFTPTLQRSGRGPLYVRDLKDPRGEADLNPHGFADLAVAQPEFRRCMARDIGEYVLGNRLSPTMLDQLANGVQPGATSARQLMRAALAQLVADWPHRELARPNPPPAGTAAPSALGGGSIDLPAPLTAELHERCVGCHDGGEPSRPNLSAARLPRAQLVAMLEEIAYGRMPVGEHLEPTARRALVGRLIATLWSGGEAEVAWRYYGERMAALPAFRPEVAMDLVHASAGAQGPVGWRTLERSVRSDLQGVTPGLAAVVSLAAIEDCRAAGNRGDALARCIEQALALANLASRPH